MPKLNSASLQTQTQMRSEGQTTKPVKYYALNIWENADPAAYLKKHNIKLPVVLKADNLARRYNVKATPGVFVIAPDKRIVYERRSGQRTQKIIDAVEKSLDRIYEAGEAEAEKAAKNNAKALKALPVSSKTEM